MLRVLQYALLCDNAFPCSIDRRSSSSVAFFAAAGAMESSFLLYCSSLLSETRVCMLSLLPCMQRLRFVFSLHALARCPACSHHLSLSLSLPLSLCRSAPYATVDTFTDSFFIIQRHVNILPDVLLTSFPPPWTGLARRHTAVSSCRAQGSLSPARRRPHPLVVADCSRAVA